MIAARTRENGEARPSRVLVVEDEPDIAALVAYQLTKEGYRVETAGNGSDALRSVHREIPGLVVLDRMLPGISGDDVLKALKSDPATRTVPVLVLTARRDQQERIEGLELGADDYLTSRSRRASSCSGCTRSCGAPARRRRRPAAGSCGPARSGRIPPRPRRRSRGRSSP